MEIYEPAEDSFLLQKFVKKYATGKVLEIGSGSGIQAETLLSIGVNQKNLTLTDINSTAVKYLKLKFPKSKVIKSNLFENIDGKFDTIIFNPPYLPEDKREPKDSRVATTGGKKGSEIINKFLKQAKKHLEKNGKILLLTSSLTKGINWLDYKKKLLEKQKIFYEELFVHSLNL